MRIPNNHPEWSIENVKIIKNSENHIFVLSRNELILLHEQHSSPLRIEERLVGQLAGLENPIHEIRVEKWMNIFVIVALTDRNLHIFHTKKAVNDIETEEDTRLTRIQTINLNYNFCQFELIRNGTKDLFLVTYEIRNETTNNLM